MNPLRKHFDVDTSLPVELVLRSTKSTQSELPDHLHDWFEIIYIHSGSGSIFINHTFYELQAGDLFLIPGNTIHRTLPNPEQPITSSAIFFSSQYVQATVISKDAFSYLRCFETAKSNRHYKLELLHDEQQRLEATIDELQEELRLRQSGYRQAVLLLLQTILLHLNRKANPGDISQPHSGHNSPTWLQAALNHIDEHLTDNLQLTALARHAAVSPSYFSRTFKQMTGLSVIEFIIAKRITMAKELLLTTDHTIAEIAVQCGFESLPHFYRMFKKFAGSTPNHYKRSI
ncbi:AraC family transcriptional regulator [Paenibacillus sp. OV219]|uniref:AraC family transcriptional regulator n=1 Tax=Paenibacillus sp. OV219 TaxID=1884377 RepID=UPI0008B9D8D6|nr:AraC family transcriptional regulator [Paenibacillus sp. OV219]SEN03814.1 transcriptional regulator, AraC family [Paenibacillus sp. OV219]